ncbi:MAG TPA: ABC-F type ribosomal protection protein [Clostridiaceae bacterium]|nr:ABC-F type ribosomal protection protein [Clostridiaceae bacterium]
MIVLSCSNISLSFGTDQILEDVSFNVSHDDRVGLVGVNGAGKSTLFKILAEELQPDRGEIFTAKGSRIGYLEQNSFLESDKTLWDELISCYSEIIDMEKHIRQLEKEISIEKDSQRLSYIMKEYDTLLVRFENMGGYEYNSRIKGVLHGLGFDENEFSRKVSTLSGGQKTRLALAKLLLEEPDILLLDEPTNHLDMDALEWLEDFLKSYKKAILVISHDRYFLDAVTSRTIELENCRCKVYNGNYTVYVKQKMQDREIQQRHYEQQQREIARIEAFIEQQKRWNRERNIIAAQSRQKALERMEKIDKPDNLPGRIKLKFKSGIPSSNDVLFVENLTMGYTGNPLFSNISFNLRKNEKAFILGPNGCGKSTLLKLLVGKLAPLSGSIEYGHNIKVAYYDQEFSDLNENNTIIEEVWNGNEKLTQTQIRNVLASFLFKGEDVFKCISVLSGGEKSRVALAKLILSDANFLILDEPTNNLDINSREVLEEALQEFDGTILAVSHDRYFVNKLATRILEFKNNSIVNYAGSYSLYLDYKNKKEKDAVASNNKQKDISASKLEYMESKEMKARQRKLQRQLEEAEKKINEIEDRLNQISLQMETASSDHVKLLELHEERTSLEKQLDELYSVWDSLCAEEAELK